MQTVKRLLQEFRALKISLSHKFVIGVAVTLIVAMGVSLYLISIKHEKLIYEQLDIQAKALFQQIVLTRRWVADHGGVFVLAPWKTPSPYLKESEIVDVKGRTYLKESPAMVTKELSQYAKKEGRYWFHITSLKLINPDNAPDAFEERSLKVFESENKEDATTVEKIGPSHFYRYMAPLYIEESCLKCHSHQGYKVGDVRGGISVSVPMDYALSMIRSERVSMILVSVTTISILLLVLYIMMKELVLRPVKELKASMRDFSKGKKQDTLVIKTGDEIEDLCDSFSEMAHSLAEYYTSLEDKVHAATKSFEEANERLAGLNEKKSDFIAKISHELRTPMTSIKGAMDYISARISGLSSSDKDTEEINEFIDVIKNNADRLIRMVNDTLDLERIESGVFDLHLSEINLLPLIKEVAISFQSQTSEKNVTFRIEAKSSVVVPVDEDRIRQVLINFISNAIEFSPENAEIKIVVIETDKSVTVAIKDEGRGIPKEIFKKIFDKFYTIGKRQGTGLGLAICKGIIEAHNGTIDVSSSRAEQGCTFYFTLPKTLGDLA
ncbi:MAG: ATP-binding protein [Nitrospirota bacterium]